MTELTNPNPAFMVEIDSRGEYRIHPFQGSLDHFDEAAAYTTLRTYHYDRVLNFAAHYQRLVLSAEILQIPINFGIHVLRSVLREAIHRSIQQTKDVRLRIIIPKVANSSQTSLFIRIEELPAYPFKGYQAATVIYQREHAEAKNIQFSQFAAEIRSKFSPNIEEILMVSPNGEILEGLSSNFYAVLDGKIYTAEKGVLFGTTREIILKICRELSLPVEPTGIRQDALPAVTEAFITSVSRGVLPITQIDQQIIANNQPGLLTQQIHGRYSQWVENHLEPL